jgi:asparagine synthase (glutamine-hydrolysing)
VKPLAYVRRRDGLAFASTPRALHAAGLVDWLSPRAVAEMLEFGYVTDDAAIYEDVEKLPAASIAEWHDGTLRVRRYWSPPAPGSGPRLSFDDAVARTEELLLAAVRARLHADVPVGALLSGGIDSGLVCWAIRELGGDITAYTVGAPGSAVDESADAEATARELGIRHEVLPLSAAGAPDISDLVEAYAEPFAVESALGLLRVSDVIRRSSVKVLLTGDGGDDVFLGYPRHKQLRLVERLARRVPGAATPLWRAARGLVPPVGPLRRARHLVDYVTGGLPAYLEAHDGLPWLRARGILGARLAGATVAQRGRPWSTASARRILEEYLEHDLRHQFVAEYLTKVDGATMHHALEARSPFFDHELWEFAAGLPVETRLHGGELKAVLRELARRRIGPRVAALRKRGFAVPVQAWLGGEWRPALERLLAGSLLAEEGWIHGDRALAALRAVPAGRPVPVQLWYLFVLEHWLRAERARGAEAVRPAGLVAGSEAAD